VADTVTLPLTGAGGTTAVVATDEVSGAHYQYVKPAFGADGTATLVSATDPLPVTPRSTGAATDTGTQVTVDNGVGGDVVVASNSARNGLFLSFSGDVYVSFGGVPTAVSSFLIYAGQPINFPLPGGFVYTGAITALATTASAVTAYRVEF